MSKDMLEKKLRQYRRHFHMNPESAFEEKDTSEYNSQDTGRSGTLGDEKYREDRAGSFS